MQKKGVRKASAKPRKKAKATPPRSKATRQRERISPRGDARFVRRDDQGQFDDVVDVGPSLAQDRKRKAKTVVSSGMGDKGDQKRRATARGAAKARSKARPSAGR